MTLPFAFAEPLWLLLLLALPPLAYAYVRAERGRHVALQVSRQEAMKGVKTWVVYARGGIQYVRWVVLALLVLAMARPQWLDYEEREEVQSRDLFVVLDVSHSMLSKDLAPDRLEAAKALAVQWINARPHDRVGLVLFAGGAFTYCPLTLDHRLLRAFVANAQAGRLPEGTAIGMGLATALHHLSRSPSEAGRAILLLTDAENNTGAIGPLQAAEMARALGVRVYAIGLGRDGVVESPTRRRFDGGYDFARRNMVLDTLLLSRMAAATGGRFFRAENAAALQAAQREIDALEKAPVQRATVVRRTDLFFWMLAISFCLLVFELLLRWGPLRVITV
ncbi:MAG: VWA domain-containing protein [Saprospiraceae bacterium]|nr:VWA domain-containing protein [Saprospiraceae bacterium]MDW8228822.1 VWA domain-containing protein [Saprospiraceae bacterium]